MVISRVITRVTPFRALITLLITYLLKSPAPSSRVPNWGIYFLDLPGGLAFEIPNSGLHDLMEVRGRLGFRGLGLRVAEKTYFLRVPYYGFCIYLPKRVGLFGYRYGFRCCRALLKDLRTSSPRTRSGSPKPPRQRRLRNSYFFVRGVGGARFLVFEAHLFLVKNVSGFEGTLGFLTQIS